MNAPMQQNPVRATSRKRWVGGVVLIAIGLLLLAEQVLGRYLGEMRGLFVLPALGIVFLAWGSVSRKVGLLIPGGILSGLGLGAILVQGPLANFSEEATGGVFLLCFASGWLLITIFSALFARCTVLWPLIPGGIMALIGDGLLAGAEGLVALTFLNNAWPVALIAVGLYMILWRRGLRRTPEKHANNE